MRTLCVIVVGIYVYLNAQAMPPIAEGDDAWVCSGKVRECHSNVVPGTFGCESAHGTGESRDIAVGSALGNCADQLEDDHGGPFVCFDGSKLSCSRESNSVELGNPIEGKLNYTCRGEITCHKAGEPKPCSFSDWHEDAATKPQAESKAANGMIKECKKREQAGDCSVDYIGCEATYQ